MKLPHSPTNQERLYLILHGAWYRHTEETECDMPRLKDLTLKECLWLLIPYMGMIAIGFFFVFIAQQFQFPWSEAVIRLGDALLIAGILAIAIELFSQNKLMQRVADELAEKLAGNGLPDLLQRQIGDLTQVGLVRTDYRKVYRFDGPRDGKMKLHLSITFTVINYGRKEMKYTPWVAEEKVYNPCYLSLDYHIGSKRCAFNEDELRHRQTERGSTHAIEVAGDPVMIPRLKDDPSAKCKVSIRYTILTHDEYSDITSFSLPTIGLTIEEEGLPIGFQFFAGADAEHKGHTWTFDRSFIEGQHVRAWWYKS